MTKKDWLIFMEIFIVGLFCAKSIMAGVMIAVWTVVNYIFHMEFGEEDKKDKGADNGDAEI